MGFLERFGKRKRIEMPSKEVDNRTLTEKYNKETSERVDLSDKRAFRDKNKQQSSSQEADKREIDKIQKEIHQQFKGLSKGAL